MKIQIHTQREHYWLVLSDGSRQLMHKTMLHGLVDKVFFTENHAVFFPLEQDSRTHSAFCPTWDSTRIHHDTLLEFRQKYNFLK
uniref:Ribosomal protein L31 n=1 Tax=Goniomonas avonlea TaxID=1255295 RepID=A0A348G6P2_9CRYP|nr:ribosomal protein L31 [Goniomonas avonlea]